MSLRNRLTALERLAREGGLLTREPPCPACGGPDPQACKIIVVDLSKGEALRTCPECTRNLDEKGRGVGVDGYVIFLDSRRADVPLPGAGTQSPR